MKRTSKLILLIFVTFLFVSSCGREITRQDVLGTYYANYDKGEVARDSIEVKNDGTYIHTFQSVKNVENNFINIGTWSFKYFNGEPDIRFENFKMGYSPNENIDQLKKTWGGTWGPMVQDGGRTFLINEDLGLRYER